MKTADRRRIVIDGLPLQVRSAGIAVYTESLVRAMAELRPATEFVLLGLSNLARWLMRAQRPERGRLDRFPPNVRWAESSLYPLITGYPLPGIPRLAPIQAVTGNAQLYHATNYAVPRDFGVPVVVTVHDLTLLRFPELGTEPLRRLVARTRHCVHEARRVIADSESTRRDLLSLLDVGKEKVRVVPLGCRRDLEPGSSRQARERAASLLGFDAPYVLHVGTIEPRKNLERLVGAFAYARRNSGLPHHLVLAGSRAWGDAAVIKKIRDATLDDVVHLPGCVSNDDLRALYRAADLFAYPSLYEGFGLPPLEAMACGIPVVTSNAASLPEVVGDAALLVDPLDELAMANAMVRGLTDDHLRQTLREAGPKRAQLFTWERCARETLAVYDEVMESS